jgi:mitogen-activated protein kinase kinase 1
VVFCGAFHTDGSVGVILEYMDLGSLDTALESPKAVTEEALAGIMFQVFWGLGYLHHDKNVHRDVKPGNTLLNSEGHVKLSDFGISRSLDGTTEMSNTYVGTFRFMSPERLLGDGYSYSGDIWSAGVMAMELWTKTCPFKTSLSSPLKLLEEIENSANILGRDHYPPLLDALLR